MTKDERCPVCGSKPFSLKIGFKKTANGEWAKDKNGYYVLDSLSIDGWEYPCGYKNDPGDPRECEGA